MSGLGEAVQRGPRSRRRTPVIDGLLVLLALAVVLSAGFLAWRWWQRQGPAPAHASPSGGLAFGSDRPTERIDIFVDPACPGCQALEARNGRVITDLISGGAQVSYHVVSFLDSSNNDQVSSRAANAAYCASDQGRFRDYLRVVMGSVSESAPPSNADLIALGGRVGISARSFAHCVDSGRYRPFVRRVTDDARAHHITAVPTVLVDGRQALAIPLPACVAAACDTVTRGAQPTQGESR